MLLPTLAKLAWISLDTGQFITTTFLPDCLHFPQHIDAHLTIAFENRLLIVQQAWPFIVLLSNLPQVKPFVNIHG